MNANEIKTLSKIANGEQVEMKSRGVTRRLLAAGLVTSVELAWPEGKYRPMIRAGVPCPGKVICQLTDAGRAALK